MPALHSRRHNADVQLYTFDILALDGEDLRELPLSMRKTNLARLLARRPDGIFIVTGMNYHVCSDQRASVTGRHPVLALGLDDVRNFGMGVAQEFLGLAAFPWWSKRWTLLIVDAMQQDGQEQTVVYVADVEQRSPGR